MKEKEGIVPEKELSIDSEKKDDQESEKSLEIVYEQPQLNTTDFEITMQD